LAADQETHRGIIMQKVEPKKNWLITSTTFQKLLSWLDQDAGSGGQAYLDMRARLVTYFDRKNCASPDDLADKTLNRVARRLEEEGKIEGETPARYCYITARFIFLEHLREADRTNVSLDSVMYQPEFVQQSAHDADEHENREKMLDCLEKCTASLEPTSREIIVGYYFGAERVKIEHRRELARQLGISTNALAIRACRIRDKLETCVRKCVAET
jgi:DNA-directed RNA polymerase specialized sigma24 family protein